MYRLIIVEDDYQIRNGLTDFFPWHQLGFEVVKNFSHGRSALDYIVNNGNIDVVLTDIRMPIMDGLELAKQLNKADPEILVVILTAFSEFEYAQKAIQYGVKDYIIKTTGYEDLISAFKKICLNLDAKHNPSCDRECLQEGYADKKLLKDIYAYINQELSTVSLQSTADKFNMSTSYLSSYFKKHSGTNYSQYLLQVKMETAARYLKDYNISISKIGEILGYSNDKNFSRAFKNHFGISPSDYKKIQ